MNKPFHERRRQQFLTEPYYEAAQKHFEESPSYWQSHTPESDSPAEAASLAASIVASDLFMGWTLRYTAGYPVDQLRSELDGVVAAYERYQQALEAYEEMPKVSPLGLDQLDDYERAMQIIGLCILLHRPDLLNRIAALIDPGYKGEDTLYEDLLAFYQPGRIEIDEWYHDEPYSPLVRSMYESDKALASKMLDDYCTRWYPAFKYSPWHDGHLRIDGTEGDYFGYWAFEAGAVAYLLELDDSTVTHMVYPKDLVAWAREHKHLSQPADSPGQRRCAANHPCPREGYWYTPAKTGSRRWFKQGEVMPSFVSDYGSTIWQWDDTQ